MHRCKKRQHPSLPLWALLAVALAAGRAAAQGHAPFGPDFDGRAGAHEGAFIDEFRRATRGLRPSSPQALPTGFGASPWDGEEVKRLAHELEEASSQLYDAYRSRSDTGNWLDKQSRRAAIESLSRLRESARHFHAQVEARYQDPEHTRADFARLVETYDVVERVLPGAYRARRVAAELDRVRRVMRALEGRYRRQARRSRWQWEGVKRLAHEVDEKASHVHAEAERGAHHGSYWERRALADLHELDEAAEHFHRQVERLRQDPAHTRSDFRRLERAYEQSSRTIRYAHIDEHVRRDFAKLAEAMEALADAYLETEDHDDGHRDHDGHDGRDLHDDDRGRRWPWGW